MSDSDCDLVVADRLLLEADLGSRKIGFRAVVVKVCFSELWLGVQSADRRVETLEAHQPLRLTAARDGAALVGESMFLRHLGSSRSRLFAIVRPMSMARVQRRAHVRAPIERPASIRQVNPATGEPTGRATNGNTVNLGPGGTLLETDLQVEVGDLLEVALTLTAVDRLTVRARVARIDAAPDDPQLSGAQQGHWQRVAVKFVKISTYDVDRITRHIYTSDRLRREAAFKRA